jgi:putative hemolysin
MTPRRDVTMLDIEATPAETLAALRATAHPRLPVQSRDTGAVLGIVTLTDAFDVVSRRKPLDLRAILRDVPVVSEHADALDVMEVLRGTPHHMAFVYDEYGHFEGIVTSGDIFQSIVGSFGPAADSEPAIVEREGGGFLVAGWMPVDEFCERLNLPRDIGGEYDTVAGLVLHHLRRLPQLGETFTAAGWRFEIVDMDDRRIDKLLVQRA